MDLKTAISADNFIWNFIVGCEELQYYLLAINYINSFLKIF